MGHQNIHFGSEARTKLMKGIDILSDSVISTLGPHGRNVIYEKDGQILSTKDGVSVAKAISNLEDPIEKMGAQILKQAALKTSEKAGDGTTTSTLLAREIVKASLTHLDNGINAVEIKREIDNSVKDLINHIQHNLVEEISNEDQLKQIASISANNDPEVGELVSLAIKKVGKDGVVHIEESKSGETYLETVEGIQFDRGYKSHYFVTDNNSMSCYLNDPYIFISNNKISQVKELLPLLEAVSNTGKSLLIIADDIDNEALATLIVNKARGILKVAAVKAPDFGERKKLLLEDIAILTGGQLFDKDKAMKLENFSWDWLGQARVVTITKEQTTIIDGKGDIENINKRVEELQTQIDKAKTPFEVEKLQERLAKMVGGVSIIYVGGFTETEMLEKKDRVDDALNATKAALEEGIVPGGGAALWHAREILLKNPTLGAKILYKACGKPFEQILLNAGYEPNKIYNLGHQILSKKSWFGYNLKSEKVVNMKAEGIIDPFKVIRVALENAISVAGTILLTETVISETKDTKDNQGVDPSMFGY